MIAGVYTVLKTIKSLLLDDPNVTTVTDGDIYDIDLSKQTLAPLSHIMLGNSSYESPVWRYTVQLACMDLVDFTDNGKNNINDILNTQHAVVSRLMTVLNSGQLDMLFQLDGVPTVEPFREQYENNWAGQMVTFDIIISNDTPSCDIPLIPESACLDGTALNSDGSYSLSVPSGALVDIPDTTYNITIDGVTVSFSAPTLKNETYNLLWQ